MTERMTDDRVNDLYSEWPDAIAAHEAEELERDHRRARASEERLEGELAAMDERIRLIFDAKNHWADRAREAESDLAAEKARSQRYREALEGLRYRDEPERFCDHAAAPCRRCDAARAALEDSNDRG